MGMKRKKRASRRRGWLLGSSATQVICISFVLLIALGTLLLTLPISSRSGRLGVVDAMFTATSATCVTGLVVRDTWTQFTPFGQAVVLLLIQVGGLGLVTLTSFFALAAKRRMGVKDLRLLGESVSASGYSQATDVLKIVVKLAMTFDRLCAAVRCGGHLDQRIHGHLGVLQCGLRSVWPVRAVFLAGSLCQ